MSAPKQGYLTVITILIVSVGALVGCEGVEPSSNQIIADLQNAIGEAQARLNELAPSGEEVQQAAAKEVGRLYTIEYKVLSLPPSISAAEMEQELVTLGQDRWECGQPFRVEADMRLLCRRIPLSYLKLLAQFARIM